MIVRNIKSLPSVVSARKGTLKGSPRVLLFTESRKGSGLKYMGPRCLLRAVFKMKPLSISIVFLSLYSFFWGMPEQLPTLDLSESVAKQSKYLSPVPWVQPAVCECRETGVLWSH